MHPEQPTLRKTDGWRHQVEAYRFAFSKSASMLAMAMGTGKSKVAVDLAVNWHAQSILILAPLKALAVWSREFATHAGAPVEVVILDRGNTVKKIERAKLALSLAKISGQRVAIVVNYETAIREEFSKFVLSRLWDLVILDESHRAKGAVTSTGKFVGKLAGCCKRRLCLTGTPMPHSPLDIFAQYRFLDARIFGWSFVKFRQNYARTNPVFPSKVEEWLNQDELKAKFASIAFRVDDDVLDLPPYTEQELRCELSPAAKRAYAELEEQLITEIESGVVTASNALVKLLRLHQVTSGFLPADETRELSIIDAGKIDLLGDLLLDLPAHEPVVVFVRFKADLQRVKILAERLDRRYGEISGSRNDLTDRAEMPEDVDLMAVQIQSGGTGIDLTRARYAVYYSVGFSLGDYLQSEARLHRPGQTRAVHYYHLIASGTIDEAIYGSLRKRQDLVEGVLSVLNRAGEAVSA
jgi:SNF2 family DNA or RNA helicase